MGAVKRKALHDGSLREDDGGVRSRTLADRLPIAGKPLDPRIDRLIRLMARQAARETLDAHDERSRRDENVKPDQS